MSSLKIALWKDVVVTRCPDDGNLDWIECCFAEWTDAFNRVQLRRMKYQLVRERERERECWLGWLALGWVTATEPSSNIADR